MEVSPALFIFCMVASGQPARQYCVVSRGNGWEVVADRNYLGAYSRQADAIRQAIDWAHEDGKGGRAAQVLLEDGLDKFVVAWTFGRDPYPAKR